MKDKETIIIVQKTFWQSILSDAWTFSGILLFVWFTDSHDSVFWLAIGCVGLFIWMIPFKSKQKKFKSREDLYKYLTGLQE